MGDMKGNPCGNVEFEEIFSREGMGQGDRIKIIGNPLARVVPARSYPVLVQRIERIVPAGYWIEGHKGNVGGCG